MVIKDDFTSRHNGPSAEEAAKMLATIGVSSMDELIEKTIPSTIRLPHPLDLPDGLQEGEYLNVIKEKMMKNKVYRSFTRRQSFCATYLKIRGGTQPIPPIRLKFRKDALRRYLTSRPWSVRSPRCHWQMPQCLTRRPLQAR